MQRIPVSLDSELWLAFKKKLLDDGMSAQEFFEKAVREYVGGGEEE